MASGQLIFSLYLIELAFWRIRGARIAAVLRGCGHRRRGGIYEPRLSSPSHRRYATAVGGGAMSQRSGDAATFRHICRLQHSYRLCRHCRRNGCASKRRQQHGIGSLCQFERYVVARARYEAVANKARPWRSAVDRSPMSPTLFRWELIPRGGASLISRLAWVMPTSLPALPALCA